MLNKKESYLCLSAVVRAREPKLLDSARITRMLEASSYAECARMLTDSGYEDMSSMDTAGVCAALNRHREETIHGIETLSPDPEVTGVFRIPYDYHNAKAIIKSEAVGTATPLMIASGRVQPDRLVQRYAAEEYRDMPGHLGVAMREAKSTLARTSNPQLADFVLDRACYADITDLAEESGNDFLKGYAALLVDSANYRTVVRTIRLGKITDVLHDALIPGGKLSAEDILRTAGTFLSGQSTSGTAAAASHANPDAITALFTSAGLENAAASAKAALEGGRLTSFELDCDNIVTAYLRSAKYVSYGPEPVIAYLAGVENEITTVRMILAGRLSGTDTQLLKERLRDTYV